MTWPRALTPVIFLAVAAAWTWPAAVTGDLLGRNPDGIGTAWFIATAPRWLVGLHDDMTGFPTGVDYGRPDSFLLGGLAFLVQAFPAARVLGMVHVLGVALSAWAAEHFARTLGARPPWSLLAGFSFAFCGLASTALIEGYAYHVFDPWMPLLAAAWWKATSPTGQIRDGVWTGVWFVCTLLTTAWLGMAASLILAGFLVAALARSWRGVRRAPILAAALTAAIPVALYLLVFAQGGSDIAPGVAGSNSAALQMRIGLQRLAGPSLSVDLSGHSQTSWPQATSIALVAVAPIVLRNVPGWGRVGAVGVAGLLISLAPTQLGYVLPDVVANNLLKFPERLGWTWALCGGAVAARVATALASPSAAGLFLAAMVDAFVVLREPWRQQTSLAEAPSAYRAQEGPVLDWWPETMGAAPVWTLRTTNISCWYQVSHRRPISDHCIFTPGVEVPRLALGARLSEAVLNGEAERAAAELAAAGFTSIAWHPDLFSPGDRFRIERAMTAVDARPAESRDGGDRVIAWDIRGAR